MMISFGGHDFLLHPSGALYWQEERMLIASDLHLEKGSHFAGKGFFLPPYDSHQTLSLLTDVCRETACEKLMLLGDAFHDDKGFYRLGQEERKIFDSLRAFNPIWIRGNHDRDFVPPGFDPADTHFNGGLSFRHEASSDAILDISGHFHPKVEIRRGLSRPCFIEDGQRMILPAFGAYTGGLYITEDPIRTLFGRGYRVYALGKNRVYQISADNN